MHYSMSLIRDDHFATGGFRSGWKATNYGICTIWQKNAAFLLRPFLLPKFGEYSLRGEFRLNWQQYGCPPSLVRNGRTVPRFDGFRRRSSRRRRLSASRVARLRTQARFDCHAGVVIATSVAAEDATARPASRGNAGPQILPHAIQLGYIRRVTFRLHTESNFAYPGKFRRLPTHAASGCHRKGHTDVDARVCLRGTLLMLRFELRLREAKNALSKVNENA